jgi:hypothetical protein
MFTGEERKKLKTRQSKNLEWIYQAGIAPGAMPALPLPLWIWLFAALAYFLIINWSFNPRRGQKDLSSVRTYSVPLFATITAVAFWLKFRTPGSWWWLALMLVILGGNYGLAAAKKMYADD